jgi:hypothetical protein
VPVHTPAAENPSQTSDVRNWEFGIRNLELEAGTENLELEFVTSIRIPNSKFAIPNSQFP